MADQGHPRDATAQTLIYALGNLGGKQKSWMADIPPSAHTRPVMAVPPVAKRGRGRPRKYPRATVAPAPAPARDPAPAPASAYSEIDSTRNTQYPVTIFPSPTPTEDHTDEAPAQQTHPSENPSDPARDISTTTTAPGTATTTAHARIETPFLDAVRTMVPHPKRPFINSNGAGDKRLCIASSRLQPPTGTAGANNAPAPAEQPELSRPASHPQPAQSHYSTPPQDSIAPLQMAAPFRPPSTQSHGTNELPALALVQTNQMSVPQYGHQPHVNSTTLAGSWYTRSDCLAKLNSFRARHPPSLDNPRDTIRLVVLRDAVDQQDWAYLTMHQYYCALSIMPQAVPEVARHLPQIMDAQRLMHNILVSNKHLSPIMLDFFAHFPYPTWELSANYPLMFHLQNRLFCSFVVQSSNYGPWRDLCELRQCPPLAHELAVHLAIASPTFQRLVFTAVLRGMLQTPPDKAHREAQKRLESAAIEIFRQNQYDYYQREACLADLHPRNRFAQQEIEAEKLGWLTKLRSLVSEFAFLLRRPTFPAQQQTINPPQHQLNVVQQVRIPQRQYTVHSDEMSHPYVVQSPAQPGRRPERPCALPEQLPFSLHSHAMQPQGQAESQMSKKLLPPKGVVLSQQRQPHPARFSLHQAHLRSPILRVQTTLPPLYHVFESFARAPARLTNGNRSIEKWTFSLGPAFMQALVPPVKDNSNGPDIITVTEQSKTVRLRCIKWIGEGLPSEHEWATADTAWIPYSYFTLNGTSLQQRKKVHNGKDLPIDITGTIQEGDNVLEITTMALSTDTSYLKFLIAIEILGLQSHSAISKGLEINRMSKDQVLGQIKRKLSSTEDDDDIAIVESNMSINLFDPFSASEMCKIPVRGKTCLHHDCFDLDTFLQSRPRKGDASVPDLWRCPICNADARPQHLFLDGFIDDVSKTLRAQGLLQTRVIVVQDDGSWKPKAEERDPSGVSDDLPTPTAPLSTSIVRPEIIDLSD
ncbi:hypothetical protein ACN47E_005471 [Coniothyrium glycines]